MIPSVEINGLSVFRNGRAVIDALDWQVVPGRIAWVVGENGSGKSTLLSILAGRVRANRGVVKLDVPSKPGSVVWYHPQMAPPPETRVSDWSRLIGQLVPPGPTPTLEPELKPRQRLGRVSTGEQRRLLLIATAALALGFAVRPGWLDLRGAASLYRYVYLATLVLVFRFDIAHDIERGFADFMAPNFIGVRTYLAARLVAGVAAVLQFAILAATLTALAPRFDLRFAAWTGTMWVLLAAFFAPVVALAETGLQTRLPVLAVALATMIGLLVAAGLGFAPQVLTVLGTRELSHGAFGSLSGVAWRALVVGIGGKAAGRIILHA